MSAFHGGRFWEAYGERFERVFTSNAIPADVLDAWYPPAPGVVEALTQDLPKLARTSPPVDGAGLVQAISEARHISAESICIGAGSSSLMYSVLPRYMAPGDTMLVYDPIYGEYPHLAEVCGCRVLPAAGLPRFELGLSANPRLAVLVNPVNPTGEHLPPDRILGLVEAHPNTVFWVDEAYLEYAPGARTLEPEAATRHNLIVCKSLSKVYALSGMRAAYLVAHPDSAIEIKRWTPPWAIGTAAQLAAVRSLEDPAYYAERHAETAKLRQTLAGEVRFGKVSHGCLNAVLIDLGAPIAEQFVVEARKEGVFLRDVTSMGSTFNGRVIRIAVRPPDEIPRLLDVVNETASRLQSGALLPVES